MSSVQSTELQRTAGVSGRATWVALLLVLATAACSPADSDGQGELDSASRGDGGDAGSGGDTASPDGRADGGGPDGGLDSADLGSDTGGDGGQPDGDPDGGASCDGVVCGAHGACELQGATAICVCSAGFQWDGSRCLSDPDALAFFNLPSEVSGPLGSARRFRPEPTGPAPRDVTLTLEAGTDCPFPVAFESGEARWTCPNAPVDCALSFTATVEAGGESLSQPLTVVCEDRPHRRLVADLDDGPGDPLPPGQVAVVGDDVLVTDWPTGSFDRDVATWLLPAGSEVPVRLAMAGLTVLGRVDGGIAVQDAAALWVYDGAELTRIERPDGQPLYAGQPLGVWEGSLYLIEDAYEPDTETRWGRLWAADGTADGTRAVAQLPDLLLHEALPGDVLYFAASDSENGRELWATDGTGPGTRRLTQLGVGSIDGVCGTLETYWNGSLYFYGRTDGGCDLVRADAAGNVLPLPPIEDLDELAIHSVAAGADGVYLLLHGYGDVRDVALWRTDGTEAGTVELAGARPPAADAFYLSSSAGLHLVDDAVYYQGGYDVFQDRVWRWTEGLDEPVPLTPLGFGSPTDWVVVGETLYATLDFASGAETWADGDSLWTIDAEGGAPQQVADVWEGAGLYATGERVVTGGPVAVVDAVDGELRRLRESNADGIQGLPTSRGDDLLLVRQEEGRPAALSTTDGLTVTDLLTLADPALEPPVVQLALRDRVVYLHETPNPPWPTESALWTTDGTPTGTEPLWHTLSPDPDTGWLEPLTGIMPEPAQRLGHRGWFADWAEQLWITDGTSDGTWLLAAGLIDRRLIWASSAGPGLPAFALYARMDSGVPLDATELYEVDLDGAGLQLITDQLGGGTSPWPMPPRALSDRVILGDDTAVRAVTRSGAVVELATYTYGVHGCAGAGKPFPFVTRDDLSGAGHLVVTDGTESGTDSDALSSSGDCRQDGETLWMRTVDDELRSTVRRYDLTDGEEAGSVAADPIDLSDDERAAAYDGRLFFVVRGELGADILWETDGTPEGTAPIAWPDGQAPERIRRLLPTLNRLYVIGESRAHGRELWVIE